eukprot:scpid5623/ scgid19657/ 
MRDLDTSLQPANQENLSKNRARLKSEKEPFSLTVNNGLDNTAQCGAVKTARLLGSESLPVLWLCAPRGANTQAVLIIDTITPAYELRSFQAHAAWQFGVDGKSTPRHLRFGSVSTCEPLNHFSWQDRHDTKLIRKYGHYK